MSNIFSSPNIALCRARTLRPTSVFARDFLGRSIPILPHARRGTKKCRLSLVNQNARTCSSPPQLSRQSRSMSLRHLSSRLCRAFYNCCRISLLRVALAAILLADGHPLPLVYVAAAVACAAYCGGRRRVTARNLSLLEVLPAKAYLRNSGRVSFQVGSEGAGVVNEAGNMQRSRDWRPQCVRRCAERLKFWKWCAKKQKKSDAVGENGGPARSSIEIDPNAKEEENETAEETVGCCGFGRRSKKETRQRC